MRKATRKPAQPASQPARALMVGGCVARVQPISGADVEVLARLWQRFDDLGVSLTADDSVLGVASAIPEALDALAQLSQIDRCTLAALHLAALIDFAEQYVRRWLDENAPYIANELAPVLARAGKAAGEIAQGLAAAKAATENTARSGA